MGTGNSGVWLEPPLVGAAHTRVVSELLDRFQKDPETGRWKLHDGGLVVLSGQSGVGKSRIVRQVYRGLREGQSQPGYWPELQPTGGARITADSTGGASSLAFRKNLGPDARAMFWPPRAVPDYLWWHLACARMPNNRYLDTESVFADQLLCHREPATYGWARARAGRGWIDRAGELLKASGRALRDEAVAETTDRVVTEIVGQAVPFSGLALTGLKAMRDALVGVADRQTRMRESTLLGAQTGGLPDPTDALVEVISSLALTGFPVVIAVEDIHLADPGLLELIRRVSAPTYRYRVLVLATIWPHPDRQIGNEPIGQWLERIGAQTINIADLPAEAVAELVVSQFPNTPTDRVTAVAARWSNPLAVNLSLDLLAHDGLVQHGAVTADDAAISEIPGDLAGIYDSQFEILTPTARQAFILDVICGADPSTAKDFRIPPGPASTWVPVRTEIVGSAGLSGARLEPDPTGQGLAVAGGWLVTSAHGWVQPREPGLAAAGWRAMNREGLRRHAPDIRSAATRILADLINTAARQPDGSPGLFIDADRFGFMDTDRRWVAESTWMLQLAPTLPDDDVIRDAAARAAMKLFLVLVQTRPQDALHQYTQWFPQWEDLLGPDHPQTLACRNNLALAYRDAGDLERATPLFEQTLKDRERTLGPEHSLTLTSRNNLALAYRDAGDFERAILLFQQNLTDTVRVLGPEHPDTLRSWNNLATAYQAVGDFGRAIPLLEQNHTDTVRILGPDHPDTLTTRNNLAAAYRDAGNLDRAIPLHEQNHTDTVRILGPDHPRTLTARSNLAHVYLEDWDVERAIDLFEQTLSGRARVLGADHPDTLATRNSLAAAHKRGWDFWRSITLYEQNLEDMERVLGPDHPDALATRANLAAAHHAVWEVARAIPLYDRAIPLYEQTLQDMERVLGPDHADTLATRANLAAAYRDAGDLERAIPLYEHILTDTMRILGPDHPDTLTSRNRLALTYQSAGDPARAIRLHEHNLTDSARVFGPDHPNTLVTRNNLASACRDAGDLDRAIPLYVQTLEDMERVLGPDDPATLTTRNGLVTAYQAAGDSGRATSLSQQNLHRPGA